jgi:nucleoid-associated protein YgaU
MASNLKGSLKYLKQHESGVSLFLGVMVVIAAAILIFSVIKNTNPKFSFSAVIPTQAVGPETTPTIEAVGIESVLASESAAPTSGTSIWQKAGKAIMGIIGLSNIANVSPTPEPSVPPNQYQLNLVKQNDGTLMPENLPSEISVAKGETLWSIAEKYYGSGYNFVDIANANQLKNSNAIEVGQTLKLPNVRVRIPSNGQLKTVTLTKTTPVQTSQITNHLYKVEKGDSLWTISVKAYGDGFQWKKVYTANTGMIKTPGVIEPGWELNIP